MATDSIEMFTLKKWKPCPAVIWMLMLNYTSSKSAQFNDLFIPKDQSFFEEVVENKIDVYKLHLCHKVQIWKNIYILHNQGVVKNGLSQSWCLHFSIRITLHFCSQNLACSPIHLV